MSTTNSIDCDLSKVDHISFGILSKEHIEKLSCVEVTEGTFYDSNGDPKLNSLFDPRMGTIERGRKCKTCEQDYIKCPGHPGHISLSKPIVNLQFVDHIVKVAKCICPKCAKLLLNVHHPTIMNIVKSTKGKNKDRFDKIFNTIKTLNITRCGINPDNDKAKGSIWDNGGCGAQMPSKFIDKFRDLKDNPSGVLELQWKTSVSNLTEDGNASGTDTISQYLNSEMVLALFKRISPEDALVMGFSKDWCLPHWLIMENVLVIPPACRPSVRQYNGQRSEDDITHKYTDIIKHNNTLKELLSKNEPVKQLYINSEINQIQYHVATLQNNEDSKLLTANTRTGRPIKGLTERLNRKEGRIRSNLMGKRVDFSARSVISPDANIKMSELGVPMDIAMNLTFPEVVNKYNINHMYKLVRNGKNIYPGAKSIKYSNNGRIQLLIDSNLTDIVLEYGDVINRHLQDGDYVLFNRQPTLHRMSMMGHRIKVMPGKTFRFNTDVCEPYNADFDGDEMNMHVPQSYQTLMELKYLTAVPHHFISPSTNSPIIKPSQDNLLGLFKITGENVLLTQIEAQHLLSGTQSFNGILPEPKIKDGKYIRWTGKQIYSVILPKISLKARPKEDKLPEVIIENGELIQGQIDKGVSGKLIHIIHSDFGNVETERYMNDLQCIISRYLIKTGFSVGVSDLVVHPDIVANNKKTIKESLKAEIDLSKKVHLDILENVTNNLSEIYEGKVAKINEKLDKTVTDNTTDKLSIDNNRIAFMVTSGAKGKNLNIKQMMCLLGQQTIDGGRVPIGFTDRTLPHYPRYENGVESRGFVSSNYLEGLNPMEFFFAAMAGREGLIDTAVKTANSGYLQRCFVKAMEDLKSAHDYTIRDNNNQIIEFMYGGDGFDPVKIEKQKTNFKLIPGDKLFKDYLFVENEKMDDYMLKKTINIMNKKYEKGWFKELNEYNKKVQKCLDLIHTSLVKYASSIDDVDLYYPVNINKLVKRTINIYQLDKISVKSSLDPVNVYHQIENLIENCKVNNRRNPVLEILVYDYLSPKKVLRDYKMNQEALDYIFAQIKLGFQKALVSSGEMVGPIAAQSLGQESTQLTLNTFHLAGVGSSSKITQGVPRLRELIKVTKNPKNPSNYIYLKDNIRFHKEKVEKIKNSIEQTKIGEILKSDPAFYLEPTNKLNNVLEEDREFMKFYEVFSELDKSFQDIPKNPWVVRMEFDRKEMIYRNISMADVHQALKVIYPGANMMYSDDNAGKLVFRLRIPFESKDVVNKDIKYLEGKAEEIKEIIIKGVDNIEKVYISEPTKDCLIKGEKCKGFTKVGEFYEAKEEFHLSTDGANLFDLLMREDVDSYRSYTSNPHEMMGIFGIEAGKFIIEQQIRSTMASNNALTSPRHIGLLVSKMSHNREFMSVDRHGINREDIGPLAKASFEQTSEQFKEAALFGAVDKLEGVSANIIVGQIPKSGTGAVKLYLDEDLLASELKKRGAAEKEIKAEEVFNIDTIMGNKDTNFCVSDDDRIKVNLNTIEKDGLSLSHIPEVVLE